jgi:hypothetical protein
MKWITYLTLCVVLFSCTKVGKNVTVKGRVFNPITNEGYADVSVRLMVPETLSLPGGYKTIKRTSTDNMGYFEISAGRLRSVWVQVEDLTGNHRIGWYVDNEFETQHNLNANKGKKMLADYHAVPYGQTILDIQNVNCSGPTDTMWFRHRSQFDNNFPENWSSPRVGCYSYIDSQPYTGFMMGTRYYQVRVKRNGQTTITEHEFFINQNGVTTIQLHY